MSTLGERWAGTVPTADSRPRRRGKLLPFLVAALLVATSGLLAWREIEPLVFFQPTDGVVLDSSVETVRVRSGPTRRRVRRRTRYVASVTYEYQVRDERFVGTRYARMAMAGSRSSAAQSARRYVPGTRVQVWYDPSHPDDAVLSRAPNPIWLGLLAVLGLIGAWIAFASPGPTRPAPGPSPCRSSPR